MKSREPHRRKGQGACSPLQVQGGALVARRAKTSEVQGTFCPLEVILSRGKFSFSLNYFKVIYHKL